jgi:hypothetical protein
MYDSLNSEMMKSGVEIASADKQHVVQSYIKFAGGDKTVVLDVKMTQGARENLATLEQVVRSLKSVVDVQSFKRSLEAAVAARKP